MTKPVKDVAASVRTRLLNISRNQGKSFDEVIILYMLERLLFRLSRSAYRDNFVLKGGLLLCVLFADPHRTTKDADFLAKQIAGQADNIARIFREICGIEDDDGLVFDADNIETRRIKEDADYEGVRVLINCRLGQARKVLQVDIGFGDIVMPKPQVMKYPVLLDMDNPEILVYSLESVVAEKFDAMIALAQMNSRMKDFYDIYILSGKFNFDGRALYEAIFETFQSRGTPYERKATVFSADFSMLENKQKQWTAFIKRAVKTQLEFEQVMERIRDFLLPVYSALLDETEFFGYWSAAEKQWRKHTVAAQ